MNGAAGVVGSGLSPRVRGKPAGGARCADGPGSIPACAGEAAGKAGLVCW